MVLWLLALASKSICEYIPTHIVLQETIMKLRQIIRKGSMASVTLLLLVTVAFAGEIHEGYGASKTAAVYAANQAAREAAREKDTCWVPAKMGECKRDADGYWTCYASSANHRGSCGSDTRKP
jgi:hypothetical protein